MFRIIISAIFATASLSASLDVLPSRYLVSYGDDNAPYQVVEFISLSCPFCVESYHSDFSKIKEELIDAGLVQWVFHPVPLEEATSRTFASMPQMSKPQRQIFLHLMMEEATKSSLKELAEIATGFAEKKGRKMDQSDEMEFFSFLMESEIDSSPVIAINGVIRRDIRPTLEEIKKEVMRHGT